MLLLIQNLQFSKQAGRTTVDPNSLPATGTTEDLFKVKSNKA